MARNSKKVDFGCIKEVHVNITNGPNCMEVLIRTPVYFVRFLSCVFSFHVGAETEEAAPVPQQPVAVMAEVAAAPPQPTTDSLLGDLLDMGPSQPVAAPSMAPAQPAGSFHFNSELLCSPLFKATYS